MLFKLTHYDGIEVTCGNRMLFGKQNRLPPFLRDDIEYLYEKTQGDPNRRLGIVLNNSLKIADHAAYLDSEWRPCEPDVCRFGVFYSLYIIQAAHEESANLWEAFPLSQVLPIPKHLRDYYWFEYVMGKDDWEKTLTMSPMVPIPYLTRAYEMVKNKDAVRDDEITCKAVPFSTWQEHMRMDVRGVFPAQIYTGTLCQFYLIYSE